MTAPRPRLRPLRLALLLLATVLMVAARGDALRVELERSLDNGVAPRDLVITYHAMHPFHGGTIVEVRGDGQALRTSRRRGDLQSSIRQVELEPEALLEIVTLLVELEAWEQRVPERAPVPDEGRARVSIEMGGLEGGFWEWYNDLGEHDRLLRVSALMTELVPR
jgi:hypothetical protein